MTERVYDLVFEIPLCLIAVLVFGPSLGIEVFGVSQIFLFVLFLGICGSCRFWNGFLKGAVPGLMAAVSGAVILAREKETRLDFVLEHLWVVSLFLLVAACCIWGRGMAQVLLVRRAGILVLAAVLFAGMYRWMNLQKVTVVSAMFLLAVCGAQEAQQIWKKEGDEDPKAHLVYLLPFFALLCLLVWVAPSSDKPYDWAFAKKLAERAKENIKLSGNFFHRGDEDFGTLQVGFSASGGIFGNLRKKKPAEVLKITGGLDVGPRVYLAGKYFDAFDGKHWSSKNEGAENAALLDALETYGAVFRYDPEYVRDYLWEVALNVEYADFHTKYFFVPEKSFLKTGELGGKPFAVRGGDLLSPKTLGYRTGYGVHYFRLNQKSDLFRDFLKDAGEMDRDSWERILDRTFLRETDGVTYRDYLDYRDGIYTYDLPETLLSERACEYLKGYLQEAGSDAEILERLESLFRGYTYTLEPGELPETVQSPEDFVDYFLFETGKGYCTHFASAFVLLARSQGIPARYVQGFYAKKGDAREVTITSDMAHAWPEAYIDGVGWIAYEPTPGFLEGTAGWKTAVRQKEVAPIDSTQPAETPHPPEEVPGAATEPGQEAEEPLSLQIPWKLLGAILGSSLLFLAAAAFCYGKLSKRWYENLTAGEKLRVIAGRDFRILEILGEKPGVGETLEELQERLKEDFTEEERLFLKAYEQAIYSRKAVSAESVRMAEKSFEKLLLKLKARKGKRYLWYRIGLTGFSVGKRS